MNDPIQIDSATFVECFYEFKAAVESYQPSYGSFRDFQSGLPAEWEGYKDWLYPEARRRLAIDEWTEKDVGTGEILNRVISAVRIMEGRRHRNNLVAWDNRYGPEGASDRLILEARDNRKQWQEAEQLLWDHFAENQDPATCFSRLVERFGGRYDLITYLFFIRDWECFAPIRSGFLTNVFRRLGVPHRMVKQCNWENYAGAISRLREVRRHLRNHLPEQDVRLIDAHSFCWMLERLPRGKEMALPPVPEIQFLQPIAGTAPDIGRATDSSRSFTLAELERQQANQKRIGALAQHIVVKAEKHRLRNAGRSDLAEKVKDVSDNLSLGYDIDSFFENGDPKPIEVKAAARRGEDWRFFLSENERRAAASLPGYHFVLVSGVESTAPDLREFPGSELPTAALFPVQYEVKLRDSNRR